MTSFADTNPTMRNFVIAMIIIAFIAVLITGIAFTRAAIAQEALLRSVEQEETRVTQLVAEAESLQRHSISLDEGIAASINALSPTEKK